MKRVMALIAVCGLILGVATLDTVSAKGVVTKTVALYPVGHSGVTGTATLTYNGKTTTVRLRVMHLRAMSIHPTHIHIGACGLNGAIIHPLQTIHAGRNGIGVSVTTFRASFVQRLWYINVHQGPGMRGAQARVIACGNIR